MHDFPPTVTAYHRLEGEQPASEPDLRSSARFLWWTLRQQSDVVIVSTLMGVVWQLPLTLGPFLVGRVVDQGILAHSTSGVLGWTSLLLAVTLLGAVFGIGMHTLVVRSWLISLYRTTLLVTRKAVQLGHVLPRRSATGEVLSVASSDSDEFGALTEIVPRATAQLVAYLGVATIVLLTSPRLGLMVLVAAPVLVGVALPLLRPLHRRQQLERERTSRLTSLATDIVAGLRVLRGIGGEDTFGRNYARQSQRTKDAGLAAGLWQAVIEAVGVLLSGCFLVLLMYVSTQEVRTGRLSVGELISFLGYGLFMVGPIQTFFELVQKITRALVSARRATTVLGLQPSGRDVEQPAALPHGGDLVDATSGLVARRGELTVVVSAVPESSAALADRLGRWGDDSEGVTYGDVPVAQAALREVRRTVLVSDTGSQLFAGSLQDAVDPHGRLSRTEAETVLRVASAEDVYDALPGGWAGELEERGRGLSGGQRQRVVLARVLGADAPVLVLVEPTSAVDAHTEARIAERVAEHRRGRTSVVMTVSPLWLHHADHVVLLHDGVVLAEGRHEDLLADVAAYRDVVARGVEVSRA